MLTDPVLRPTKRARESRPSITSLPVWLLMLGAWIGSLRSHDRRIQSLDLIGCCPWSELAMGKHHQSPMSRRYSRGLHLPPARLALGPVTGEAARG
eukprot:scaffold375_cov378-Prasinococcus_capsulatus_cf.AAC.19